RAEQLEAPRAAAPVSIHGVTPFRVAPASIPLVGAVPAPPAARGGRRCAPRATGGRAGCPPLLARPGRGRRGRRLRALWALRATRPVLVERAGVELVEVLLELVGLLVDL